MTTIHVPRNASDIQAIYISSGNAVPFQARAGFVATPPFTPIDVNNQMNWNSWNSAPDSAWSLVDLSAAIVEYFGRLGVTIDPATITALHLGGLLIMSRPSTCSDAPCLMCGFRQHGDVSRPYPYIGEGCWPGYTGGARLPFARLISAPGGRFDFKWACVDGSTENQRLITPETYPARTSYVINLTVDGVHVN